VETAETAVETPAVTEPALIAPELIGKPLFEPVIANTDPGVDAASTTSALTSKDKPFDPSSFELRLN
jgi:hypothetical protein